MSNKTLRAMYAGMVKARVLLGSGRKDAGRRAAFADVACWASAVVGLAPEDVVFGCRGDGVLEMLRGKAASLPRVEGGVARLYAAVGAGMAVKKPRVVMGFFERHEVGGRGWAEALRAAAELPLILVVMPRWKGLDKDEDICREARNAGVPGIAVDAMDAVALYRVAQESLVRARMGGGAALIEGVRFRLAGDRGGADEDAVEGLGAYLLRRGVASESWMRGVGAAYSRERNALQAAAE